MLIVVLEGDLGPILEKYHYLPVFLTRVSKAN